MPLYATRRPTRPACIPLYAIIHQSTQQAIQFRAHALQRFVLFDEQRTHEGVIRSRGHDACGIVDHNQHVPYLTAIFEIGSERSVGPCGELRALR